MAGNRMEVIDGDGHVMGGLGGAAGVHAGRLPRPFPGQGEALPAPGPTCTALRCMTWCPALFRQVGPPGWLEFMDDVGIDRAVLYPTGGLAVGKVINGDFAIEICQAYNNWFHDTYLKTSGKFQGLGLIPMQEPPEAVKELRRIVEELGFCGAMLPSMGLKGHLGSKEYWPVYAEAHRLGCSIAVHGGAHEGLGMDYLTPYAPINGLGHPFGQMVCFAGFVFNGLFDRYPNMRVGFMEGGVAWIHTCLERFDRGWETHVQYDPRGEFIQLRPGDAVSDYIRRPRRRRTHLHRLRGHRAHPATTPSRPWATSPSCSPAISPTRSTTSTASPRSARSSRMTASPTTTSTACCTGTRRSSTASRQMQSEGPRL